MPLVTAEPTNPGPSFAEEVYEQLRALARRQLATERSDHTLQPTALVHEAWLKLCEGRRKEFASPGHYRAAAAQAMRRILLDHAKARGRAKRGGGAARVTLAGIAELVTLDPERWLDLEQALQTLEAETPEVAAVVQLRVFGGLSVAETAEQLGVAPRTVDRDWLYARARLRQLLGAP